MKLTLKKAKEIRELFGPTTVLYETCGEAALANEVAEGLTVREFISLYFSLEDIYADRAMSETVWKEFKAWKKGATKRLRAAGYVVPR